MAKHAVDVQENYSRCQQTVDVNKTLFKQEAGDWRQSYLDFLQNRLLPPNRIDAAKVRNKSFRFFEDEGILFKSEFNQAPLRCIVGEEITTILLEVHSSECGEHQGRSRLAKQIMHLG